MSVFEEIANLPLEKRIDEALKICRPYLQADGGDVELLRVGDDGVVELAFHGTCTTCPLSKMTLRAGIERVILRCAPEVRRVETIVKN